MMNFVLEKNNFRSADFDDPEAQQVFDLEESSACLSAAYNINFIHRKLEGVKEIVVEKMLESI